MEGITFYFEWEVALIQWLQAHLGGLGLSLVTLFTLIGDQVVCIALMSFIYYCLDKNLARRMGLSMLVAINFNIMIKGLVMRMRPYFVHENIKCLRPPEKKGDIYDLTLQGYSFPSGHSSNSANIYGTLALNGKKLWLTVIGILFPFLVGFSRICLGVHYPTDVLFGWLMGVIMITFLPLVEKKINDKRIFYGIIILLTTPGWFFVKEINYFTAYGALIGLIIATEFENKYVNFEMTKKPLKMILRILGGALIYLVLSNLLKLPFSKEFLESPTLASHIIRSIRYMIIIFVNMGLYPMLFKKSEGKKAAELNN